MTESAEVRSYVQELVAVRPALEEAEKYYLGTMEEYFESLRVRQLLGKTGQKYRLNFARTPVDVLLERTEIAGISCSDGATQSFIDDVWKENELGLEAKDVHRTAYEFGDAYIIAQPDSEFVTGVSAYAHDPRYVRVFYDPSKPRRKSHAIQTWLERGTEQNGLGTGIWFRVNIYWPDRTELFSSMSSCEDAFGKINIDVDALEFRFMEEVPNEIGIIPVFHFRTGRPYGRPEHADAYGPQNMINKTLPSMMGAMDYAVAPQRYALTEPAGSTDAASAFDDTAGDANGDISEESGFEAGPGTTHLYRNAKEVGQFPAADMDNYLKPVHSIVQMMAAVTDVPMHYFDLAGGMPSGESYRAANGPLDKKVEDRHARFGITWNEFFDYCKIVGGKLKGETTINWKPSQTFTDLESWQAANEQISAGVPKEQVWRERGYTDAMIEKWLLAVRPEPSTVAIPAETPPNSPPTPIPPSVP